ncbi:malate synthase [Bacillus mycoides]|uniref:malate synthase n=2 Tax=Bacillus TaxID=1386 RepID=UPI003D199290
MFEKILKEMIDYCTSIRYKYFSINNDTGNIIFLFIVLGTLIIVSFIIEEMMKRIFRQYVKNEVNYVRAHKMFEKVMGTFILSRINGQ